MTQGSISKAPPPDPPEDGSPFSTIRRVRSSEEVVGQIRRAIQTGQLAMGDRLPGERELCSRFGVSRATLREALRTLEAFGYVEIKLGAHGGAFVTEPEEAQAAMALDVLLRFKQATARDLGEFRTSFEAETAYWAAERATDSDLQVLDGIVARLTAACESNGYPWEDFAQLDIAFHEQVALASGNQVRVAIMLGIHRAFYRASSSLAPIVSVEDRIEITQELAAIQRALCSHEAELARDLMRAHVEKFTQLESETETRPSSDGSLTAVQS